MRPGGREACRQFITCPARTTTSSQARFLLVVLFPALLFLPACSGSTRRSPRARRRRRPPLHARSARACLAHRSHTQAGQGRQSCATPGHRPVRRMNATRRRALTRLLKPLVHVAQPLRAGACAARRRRVASGRRWPRQRQRLRGAQAGAVGREAQQPVQLGPAPHHRHQQQQQARGGGRVSVPTSTPVSQGTAPRTARLLRTSAAATLAPEAAHLSAEHCVLLAPDWAHRT